MIKKSIGADPANHAVYMYLVFSSEEEVLKFFETHKRQFIHSQIIDMFDKVKAKENI